MEVFIERENKTIQIKVEKDFTAKKLLEDMDISPESAIIVKNGAICLEDELIEDDDKIKILSVVSGG